MAQIGEPQRFIISEPMFEPIPNVEQPEVLPERVDQPEEVPDGVHSK